MLKISQSNKHADSEEPRCGCRRVLDLFRNSVRRYACPSETFPHIIARTDTKLDICLAVYITISSNYTL